MEGTEGTEERVHRRNGGTETLTGKIIGAAIEAIATLDPGCSNRRISIACTRNPVHTSYGSSASERFR